MSSEALRNHISFRADGRSTATAQLSREATVEAIRSPMGALIVAVNGHHGLWHCMVNGEAISLPADLIPTIGTLVVWQPLWPY